MQIAPDFLVALSLTIPGVPVSVYIAMALSLDYNAVQRVDTPV